MEKQTTLYRKDLLNLLPDRPIRLVGDIEYDTTESEYAEIIRRVVADEIGEGEGANFVIPRNGCGRIGDITLASACGLFTALVREDYGTYWKYLFYDVTRFVIGSTPERHLLVERGRVKMNPTSGTFRKDTSYDCRKHFKEELLGFLGDPKEINELFMVVDEELKMIARMCRAGGSIVGPLLKEMFDSPITIRYRSSPKTARQYYAGRLSTSWRGCRGEDNFFHLLSVEKTTKGGR